MKRLNFLPIGILTVLLLGAVVAVYVNRDTGQRPPGAHETVGIAPSAVIDTQLLDTANGMAARAESADEQNQARKALHLADHELDQAFATALRETAAYRAPSNGP